MTTKRIAVVGGGISGLAAAYHLSQARQAGAPIEEYLFEGDSRLGGALRTERVEGCVVETGADCFLTEKKEASQLCQELGLGADLIGSQDEHRGTLILHDGKLARLPEGFEFMVPTKPLAVLRTPLLSWRDKLSLPRELFRSPRPESGEESVADFIRRHFGESLLENIVDPLLTAVYGGDPEQLSAPAVLPRFVELEQTHGSLILGLRHAAARRQRRRTTPVEAKPVASLFTTLRGGLGTLVKALEGKLEKTRRVFGRRVEGIDRVADSSGEIRYRIGFQDGSSFEAHGLILALPAYEAARLLEAMDAKMAGTLAQIPYSSSLIVATGYDARAGITIPSGFGFLVPRREKPRLQACTFVGQKFSFRVPENLVLFRCFLGGVRDPAALELADEEVRELVHRELGSVLGFNLEPSFTRAYRWPRALAQYTVGHQQRITTVRDRLARHSGLALCGNAYEGIGIPDCIRSGRRAAENCLRELQES